MANHSPPKLWIPSFVASAFLVAFSLASGARGQEPPKIKGHAIDPEQYRLLVKHGFLPTRTTFLSNEEIARKFDHLSLAQVHAALAYYHANLAEIDADLESEARATEVLEEQHRR